MTIIHDALDLTILGSLCTVQGPTRHGQVRPVQLGPHHTRTALYSTSPSRHGEVQPVQRGPYNTGTPLCSTGPLHTWTSSTCTAWISLYRDPSVQYKAPPDMDKFSLYSLDLIVEGPLCTVQDPSRHGQVQHVQLRTHCTGTPLYSTRPLKTWISSTCTAWTSLYRDCSVQYNCTYIHGQVQFVQLGPHCTGTPLYSTRPLQTWTSSTYTALTSWYRTPLYSIRAPPDMNKFSLYSVDLIVQGLLSAVQGPSRHGQVQPVQLGPHCTGTPLYSKRAPQTWISSTCTAWTSLYRDPSIQYKDPPDMDKFNLYSLDLVVQGPSVYSTRPLQKWTSSTCTAWTSLYRDPSIQYKASPDMDKFSLYSLDLTILGPLCTVQGPSSHG